MNKKSIDWFLSGWCRATLNPDTGLLVRCSDKAIARYNSARKRKIDSIKCDNCGHQAKYWATHEYAGQVAICQSCRKSHASEHINIREIK
jgi:predicted RNA-binding Zn-ribbon protein involved in translation (DUF1610 family)